MASEWGPFHGRSHSTKARDDIHHTHIHTRWWALWLRWLSLVPGPRRDGEGPESHRQPLCCRRGNQPLYVRHVFLFVFFFMSLMWARGNVSPLISSPPSPLFCVISPQYPSSSLLPPIHPHLFLLFFPPSSSSSTPFLPYFASPHFFPPGDRHLLSSLLGQPISLSWCCGLPLTQPLFIYTSWGFGTNRHFSFPALTKKKKRKK